MSVIKRVFSAALVAALFGLAGCDPAAESGGGTPAGGSGASVQPASLSGKVPVTMETSMGTIELELDADKAPISTANFVEYAKKGHYDGTIFHRVISDFMIQGGGFTEELKEKSTGDGIKNEGQNGLKNERGTIAMARTSDPDSATAQFFINVADNTMRLDYPNPDGHGYAVFGKVTKGMDVVDKIKAVSTGVRPLTALDRNGNEAPMMSEDVPNENVVIKSVKVGEPRASSAEEPAADAPAANTPAGEAPAAGAHSEEKKTP